MWIVFALLREFSLTATARASKTRRHRIRPSGHREPYRGSDLDLFLLEALTRELEGSAVLRDGAHDVIRGA